MDREQTLHRCRELIRSATLLTLATSGPDGPLTSLMGFAASESGCEFYMPTLTGSRKWKNIGLNPRVSLLIDDREIFLPGSLENISSITITGTHYPVTTSTEHDRITALIGQKHPELLSLLSHPASAIIRVRVESFLLLDGPQKSEHIAQIC